jgi:hypothetical protein
MTDENPGSDFEAAKKIVDELKDLPKERQERVLRWVAESVGVTLAPSGSSGSSERGSGQHTPPVHPSSPPPPVGTGGRDIRTFVAEKVPSSDNQFAAVVAYYYRFEAPPAQRKNTIGGADLQEAARLAGRKRLSNPRQTLKNAKNMGYLDNKDRGEFSINTVGENLVAMTLPVGGEAAAQRGTRRSSGKRAKSKSSTAKRAVKKGR